MLYFKRCGQDLLTRCYQDVYNKPTWAVSFQILYPTIYSNKSFKSLKTFSEQHHASVT